MSVLSIILLIIGLLLIFVLVRAAMASKDYVIKRQIDINRATPDVYQFIIHIKNQQLYNKWVMADPNTLNTYKGTDGTTGFIYAWESKKTGKGEQEICYLSTNQSMRTELRFEKPFKSISNFEVHTTPSSTGTLVTWVFSGDRNFGMRIMHVVINVKKLLSRDIMITLNNLKRVLETA